MTGGDLVQGRAAARPRRREHSVVLPEGPGGAARARRVVRQHLDDWGCRRLTDDAVLCVSEVVTNALVHAGGDVRLTLRWRSPRLRVEVRDRSRRTAVTPRTVVGLAEQSGGEEVPGTTGRGLLIVATLATALGESADEAGKTVWFELDERPTAPGGLAAVVHPQTPADAVQAGRPTVLADVPVEEAAAVERHVDELTRELLQLGDDPDARRLVAALEAVGRPFPFGVETSERILLAGAQGRASVDLEVHPSASFRSRLEAAVEALGEAQELMGRGRLLALPAPPGVVALWRRYRDELAGPPAGGGVAPPTPSATIGDRRPPRR